MDKDLSEVLMEIAKLQTVQVALLEQILKELRKG